jgi:hypothetical protein
MESSLPVKVSRKASKRGTMIMGMEDDDDLMTSLISYSAQAKSLIKDMLCFSENERSTA